MGSLVQVQPGERKPQPSAGAFFISEAPCSGTGDPFHYRELFPAVPEGDISDLVLSPLLSLFLRHG